MTKQIKYKGATIIINIMLEVKHPFYFYINGFIAGNSFDTEEEALKEAKTIIDKKIYNR